jgi:phospholipase C
VWDAVVWCTLAPHGLARVVAERGAWRRVTLGSAAVAVCALGVLTVTWSPSAAPSTFPTPALQAPTSVAGKPAPTRKPVTPIEHFVVLMQENHSFDNYFGTYKGADGIPPGVCMPRKVDDPSAGCVKPFAIRGNAVPDLAHTTEAHDGQFNGGKMNGFVQATARDGASGTETMGYYDDRDIPYYWNVADEYVLFDRFFTSAAGGSVTNHMYWVTGTSGGVGERIPKNGWGDLPTIFDRLEAAGVSWKFYVQNFHPQITYRAREIGDKGAQIVWAPLLAYGRYLDDPRLFSKIVDLKEYFEDVAHGTLPSVAYIVPSGASEHPPGNIRAGERLVRTLINALTSSSMWSSSAFMWTYDDWGGWYDHVPPPRVDREGYGFRVPTLMVSPYARRGHVDSTTLDFTSILKFIEVNWRVEPLAVRDRRAKTFLGAFDFAKPPREPVFLSATRGTSVRPKQRTDAIYVAYASALVLPALLIGWGALTARRRREHAALEESVRSPEESS